VLDGDPDFRGEGTILVVVQPIREHCESLLRYTQQKNITASTAADCIAPDWPVSH